MMISIDQDVFDSLQRELHDYRNLADKLIDVNSQYTTGHPLKPGLVVAREYVRSTQTHIRKWQMQKLADKRAATAAPPRKRDAGGEGA
jgi:hypothetical protein